MIAACLLAGTVVLARIPGDAFTLRWIHSIERIAWEEDYEVQADAIVLTASRVRGSGAGMEPGEKARWRDGAWETRLDQRLAALALTRSPFARDYEWCASGACRPLAHWLGAATEIQFIRVTPC